MIMEVNLFFGSNIPKPTENRGISFLLCYFYVPFRLIDLYIHSRLMVSLAILLTTEANYNMADVQ